MCLAGVSGKVKEKPPTTTRQTQQIATRVHLAQRNVHVDGPNRWGRILPTFAQRQGLSTPRVSSMSFPAALSVGYAQIACVPKRCRCKPSTRRFTQDKETAGCAHHANHCGHYVSIVSIVSNDRLADAGIDGIEEEPWAIHATMRERKTSTVPIQMNSSTPASKVTLLTLKSQQCNRSTSATKPGAVQTQLFLSARSQAPPHRDYKYGHNHPINQPERTM